MPWQLKYHDLYRNDHYVKQFEPVILSQKHDINSPHRRQLKSETLLPQSVAYSTATEKSLKADSCLGRL